MAGRGRGAPLLVSLALAPLLLARAADVRPCPSQYFVNGRCRLKIGVVAQPLFGVPTNTNSLLGVQSKDIKTLEKFYADHFASLPSDGSPLIYRNETLAACANNALPCPLLGFDNDLREIVLKGLLNADYDIYVFPSFNTALYATRINEVDIAWFAASRTRSRDVCTSKCKQFPDGLARTAGNVTDDFVCCLDFGPSYYNSGLAVLTKAQNVVVTFTPEDLLSVFNGQMTRFSIYFAFALIVFSTGYVIWEKVVPGLFQKKKLKVEEDNMADQTIFNAGPSMLKGMYFGVTTATSIGYGDIAPVTFIGRLISMMWMLFGLAFTGVIVGFISSAFVELRGNTDLPKSVKDLRGEKVCVPRGYYSSWLDENDAVVEKVSCPDILDCISQLNDDKCKFALYEQDVFNYLMRSGALGAKDYAVSKKMSCAHLALAFPENSPLWSILSGGILSVTSEERDQLSIKWTGLGTFDEIENAAAEDQSTVALARWEFWLMVSTACAYGIILVLGILWATKGDNLRVAVTGVDEDEEAPSDAVDAKDVKVDVASSRDDQSATKGASLESALELVTEKLQMSQESAMSSLRDELKLEIAAVAKAAKSAAKSPRRATSKDAVEEVFGVGEGEPAGANASGEAMGKLAEEVGALRKTLDDNTVSTQDLAYLLTKQGSTLEEVTEKVNRSEMRMDEWNVMLAAQAEEIADLMNHVNAERR